MLRMWLLGLLAVSFAQAAYYDSNTADTDFLLKQKKIYNLLYHVNQPLVVNRQLYEEGQAWSIADNANLYAKEVSENCFACTCVLFTINDQRLM